MSGSYYTLDAKYNTLLALIQQNATTGNTLEAVLTQGNDAAGLSMTNVDNIDLVTINGNAYPPLVAGDNLEQVLTNGNDANGLSMTNLNDVALTTINGSAYPPLVADNTLTEVLTAGNDAGGLSMTNLNDVALTTINGAAYPPAIPTPTDITITDDNTNAVFYPTFVSGTGTQTLKADTTTTQFSINPNTSDFNVGSTLKLTQSELAIGKTSGTSQGSNCIAIGAGAGLSQTTNAIAIGGLAGQSQTNASIAIGFRAGETQGLYGIAVGLDAGKNQLVDTIAIGRNAGQGTSTAQGANAIAIGLNAGVASQTAGSICLNASGVALNPAVAGCFINPIRLDDTLPIQPVCYNNITKELFYTSSAKFVYLNAPAGYANKIYSNGSVVFGGLVAPFLSVKSTAGLTNSGTNGWVRTATVGAEGRFYSPTTTQWSVNIVVAPIFTASYTSSITAKIFNSAGVLQSERYISGNAPNSIDAVSFIAEMNAGDYLQFEASVGSGIQLQYDNELYTSLQIREL